MPPKLNSQETYFGTVRGGFHGTLTRYRTSCTKGPSGHCLFVDNVKTILSIFSRTVQTESMYTGYTSLPKGVLDGFLAICTLPNYISDLNGGGLSIVSSGFILSNMMGGVEPLAGMTVAEEKGISSSQPMPWFFIHQ